MAKYRTGLLTKQYRSGHTIQKLVMLEALAGNIPDMGTIFSTKLDLP